MRKKIISLIEDDVDGVEVVIGAPDQETLTKEAISLWEAFCAYPNKNYAEPLAPGLGEFNDEGGVDCTFTACYPITIAKEIVEDWLSQHSKVCETDEKENTYSYW